MERRASSPVLASWRNLNRQAPKGLANVAGVISSTVLDCGSGGMIQFEMKRWRSLILALVVVGLVAFCGPHLLEKRAQQKREIAYELALRSYSEHFRPGMTRKEVEDHLRGRNIGFQQMCCVDDKLSSKGVWDDITKIGKESAPWFCSENNVYVAFQFIGPARSGVGWGADPSDTLKSVSIYHWLEGCL